MKIIWLNSINSRRKGWNFREREKKGRDERGGKCYEMFSVVGLSQQSARCAVVVGTVPEASFKEDLGGEGGR